MKLFSLQAALSEIEGKPANKWLEENEEVIVNKRKDGVVVRNICCINLYVNGKSDKFKQVPMSTAVLLKPEENSKIKIGDYIFTLKSS